MRNAILYNFAANGTGCYMVSNLLSFIRLLKQGHEGILRRLAGREQARRNDLLRSLESLTFAEACLEKAEINRAEPDYPLQIAVLGPTQAGKSSLINWLLTQELAKTSPLAGYTVHPQGFAIDIDAAKLNWLDGYFRHYRRCLRKDLSPESYDSFLLEHTTAAEPRSPFRNAAIWDTPDFDSVDAEGYRQAVLRVAALADVVILVLSKDKYADLAVWELIKLLAPLEQPAVACLNKIDPGSFSALKASFEEKWRSVRRDAPPPILPIPYLDSEQGLSGLTPEREAVLGELGRTLRSVQRNRQDAQARRLILAHWPAWTKPVKMEHRLLAEWSDLVDTALQESLELYRRDYLNHPHHYETFQRALAELLTLLEIPGLGGALVAARRVVTWPLRQIANLGRSHGLGGHDRNTGAEAAVLRQVMEHLLIRTSETLLLRQDEDSAERAWWRNLSAAIREQKTPLLGKFEAAARAYLQSFQPEIEATARGLYEHLKKHPAVLNGLRATRATTDAAALALGLQTGGIGLQDFIIAPAVLSLTSMLAESALGHYLDRAAEDLKVRQLAAVETLFREAAGAALLELPDRLDQSGRMNISPEALRAAEALLG